MQATNLLKEHPNQILLMFHKFFPRLEFSKNILNFN